MAEFKTVLGTDFDAGQAIHILWYVLDPWSKEIAMAAELNAKGNKDLYEPIDLRYMILFGHLNYTATSKDDPMGLVLMVAHRNLIYGLHVVLERAGAAAAATAEAGCWSRS